MGVHWSSTKRSRWFAVITVATVEGATTEPADVIAGRFFHSRVSKGGNRSGCLPFFLVRAVAAATNTVWPLRLSPVCPMPACQAQILLPGVYLSHPRGFAGP